MLNIGALLQKATAKPAEGKRLVEAFVSDSASGRRYLLGRNEHATQVMQAIEIDGIIDDYAASGTHWNNKPVITTEQLPERAMVVNCAMCIAPVSAARRLQHHDGIELLSLADLCGHLPQRFKLPWFVSQSRDEVSSHLSAWNKLYGALADEASQQTLKDLLQFRLSGDYRSMSAYCVRPEAQYFEPFIDPGAAHVFVDGGGYDGDTTEAFCHRYPDYRKVYLFEPSVTNLANARRRLQQQRDIVFIDQGLSDQQGQLPFNAEAGSASAVDPHSSQQIRVTTLDQYVSTKISFIKMDLEGWELQALHGARRHILEERPNLAIAVYHQAADFRTIFEYITGLCPDYRVYLRHYTEGWSETIMYFIPADSHQPSSKDHP
ncbi:MAG: FkbM family methyltransferase [Candidatus Thiodiazotropha taylori]|nr:FkbM family methyltransferase [Candidatus Thiodiazotropha taylori]